MQISDPPSHKNALNESAERFGHFVQRKMTLKQLRVLLALQQKKTVAATSSALGMTSANISLCLRDIEQHVGHKLFNRQNGIYTPTLHGQVLIDLGDRIFEECDQALCSFRHRMSKGDARQLTIGYIGTVMASHAYDLWRHLLKQPEKYSLHVSDISCLCQGHTPMPSTLNADIVFSSRALDTLRDSPNWQQYAFTIQRFHFVQSAKRTHRHTDDCHFLLPECSSAITDTLIDYLKQHFPSHGSVSYYDHITSAAQAFNMPNTIFAVSDQELPTLAHYGTLETLGSTETLPFICHVYVHRQAFDQSDLKPALTEHLNTLTSGIKA